MANKVSAAQADPRSSSGQPRTEKRQQMAADSKPTRANAEPVIDETAAVPQDNAQNLDAMSTASKQTPFD